MIQHTQLADRFYRITGVRPQFDYVLSIACGKKTIDIFELKARLAEHSGNYDPENCVYKGKPEYSTMDFVKEEYGQEAHDVLAQLL